MSSALTKIYNSYHFGSSSNLTEQQLKQLIRLFNTPTITVDSVLGGRSSVMIAQIEGVGSVVVKYYTRGGLVRYLVKRRYLKWGKTRCQIEYELLQKVRSLGVSAPEPITYASRGRLFYEGWLVTREINNTETLAELSCVDEERSHIVMEDVINQVSTLINNRIFHVDLHPGNVLVDSRDRVFLLDFDKARLAHRHKNKLRDHYLARWRRAVMKHQLPDMLFETLSAGIGKNSEVNVRQMALATTSTKERPPHPSILIILMGSLGDVVRGLSLVSHIKNHLPESRVTWLVEPKWTELVGFHPQIDRMIVFNRHMGVQALWNLYKHLAQEHFDITLDLQRHLKSGFFSLLSRAKRRVGFNRRNAKEFNWLFNNEQIDYFSDELPKLHHYLKFTEYLGLPEPASLEFGFSSLDSKALAPSIVTEISDPFIAVVMGSSWESKDWLFEGYCGLVKNILSSGKRKVVLLGDRSKVIPALRLSEKIGSSELINLVGKTSLLELVAVLKAAAVGVGPDSGPGHLAAAVGTPYVSLFGPTSPSRTAPYGSEHLVIQSEVACAPCYKKECPGLDRLCMRLLSVEAVQEKVSEALAMRGIG
jgi:lipopolysaccharide heptosyltransferase II